MLAYLAYHLNRSHSRESLIEVLWSEADEKSGRNNLSMSLSFLRGPLELPGESAGSVLLADRVNVQLNPAAVTTDVMEFTSLLGPVDESDSIADSAQRVEQAISLYKGPLLPNFYEDWIDFERDRLAELYLGAVRRLTRILVQRREFDRAVDFAIRAVSADPLREENHRDLMRLLVATNQPTAALRQYEELERILRSEIDEAPSEASRQLASEIEQSLRSAPQATRSLASPPPRLAVPAAEREPLIGTVTFLATDVEGSMALSKRSGSEFQGGLRVYHEVLRRELRRQRGVEVQEAGDSFLVAFHSAGDALACASSTQRSLAAADWPDHLGPLRVRMALHTGDVGEGADECGGSARRLASKIAAAGHGGQILCSESTANLVRRNLDAGIRLKDLGAYRLPEVEAPERLYQVDHPGAAATEFPPLHAAAGHAANLPQPSTGFFGRETEIATLIDLLSPAAHRATRLVTLTGPGGTGKTRLSLQVAQRLLDAYRGAVWFIPLADLVNAQLIPGSILDALRIPRGANRDPLMQICEALGREPTLLILDNFEQLVEEGAAIVRAILQGAPATTILVSSRRALELSVELAFPVTSLPVPNPSLPLEQLAQCDSVRLFVDRARAARPDFHLTERNAPPVAELCAGLDGLPLAIELAAARAAVLTPVQMVNQLSRRLDFLAARNRDWAKRHRTLRATIEWSFRLLDPALQQFFCDVSVFRGGWTLEAAESVCDDPLALDRLSLLRSHSLVHAEDAGEEMRFRMPESLREFGNEQLAPDRRDRLRARQAAWFSSMAEEAEDNLAGPEQVSWLDRLTRDHDNIRAAISWCEELPEERVETEYLLLAAPWRFWLTRGHVVEASRSLAAALVEGAAMAGTINRLKALDAAGVLAFFQDDLDSAELYWTECVALGEELGETLILLRAQSHLAYIATSRGDNGKARKVIEATLPGFREIGTTLDVASALSTLGVIAYRQGDHAGAKSFQQEAITLYQQIGHQWGLANCHSNLVAIQSRLGELGAALAHGRIALSLLSEIHDLRLTAISFEYYCGALVQVGQKILAAKLLGAATSLREKANVPILEVDVADHEATVAAAMIGESEFQVAFEEGRSLSFDEALRLALESAGAE